MIHHRVHSPRRQDAFRTGYIDALLQVMLPLLVSVYVVCPHRTALSIFGVGFSWWLYFVHSECDGETHPWMARIGFVTPWYHKGHHCTPRSHFATMWRWA